MTYCDFDECDRAATVSRGSRTYCPQHAAERDTIVRERRPQSVYEHPDVVAVLRAAGEAARAVHITDEQPPATEHPLQTLLRHYAGDCEIRPYSGRGLYGTASLAIVGPLGGVVAAIVAGCFAEAEEFTRAERTAIRDAVAAVRSDSIGYDTVVYFPGTPYVKPE